MKNKSSVTLFMLLLGMVSTSQAGLIFSVDFGGDSVNDTTAGNVSVGTATGITFADVSIPATNSNGRAAVFNGSTSKIDYGLGAGSELDIDGGGYTTPTKFTYHARVKFNTVTAANQFLMGRQNGVDDQEISAIEVLGSGARGFISTSGANDYGHTAAANMVAGTWYDIFFRFQGQYAGNGDGYLQTSVYNAENNTLVAHSAVWGTGARGPFDGTAPFLVGLRGDGANALDGMVEQVNVWIGTPLSEADMLEMSSIPEPATLGLVAAFGGGVLLIRRRLMI